MSLREDLVNARSYLVTIGGLVVAFALAHYIDTHSTVKTPPPTGIVYSADLPAAAPPRPLTDTEKAWAATAWRYFVNNTQAATGLVNSVNNYPAATLWDSGSYLNAVLAADRLGLITAAERDQRLDAALASLAKMDLVDGKLPNKSYNTQSLAMVDYTNKPAKAGIGWSAIDVARMLQTLQAISWQLPQHAAQVHAVVSRWDLPTLVENGDMIGASRDASSKLKRVQEGRVGYEQYAGNILFRAGLNVAKAASVDNHLAFTPVYGIDLPIDDRDPKKFQAHTYVLSEPYMLAALETGLDRPNSELAWRVYKAQEARFHATGTLTAVSEDHIDQAPYFVYNCIYVDGKTWATITDTGADASAFRSLSVKAAFAWDALYHTDYTRQLVQGIGTLNDPARGWFTGLYEATGKTNTALNANTNAVVLEALAYRQGGRLLIN